MPKYPGAAIFSNIVAYAREHGIRPSLVYADYKQHPSDYQLMWAHRNWEDEQQRKEADKNKPPDSATRGRAGRLGHS